MSSVNRNFDKLIKLFLYIVVIVLVNVAGVTLSYRLDLTENKVYTLSDVSKNVVATLADPLTIEVFFTKDLPAPYNNTEQYLRDMLKEYSLHANQYFNYRFYNVSAESDSIGGSESDENRALARDYGITPVRLQSIAEDEVKAKTAYMGLVLIHGKMVERIDPIIYTTSLEYKLTTAIQRLNHRVSAMRHLDDKVQVKLVLSSTLYDVAEQLKIDRFDRFPQHVNEVVQKMNSEMFGKLVFSHIDPTKTPEKAEEAEKLHIPYLPLGDTEKENAETEKGFIGLIVQYKNDKRVIPILDIGYQLDVASQKVLPKAVLADPGAVKELININMKRLININQDLGYLADHGTLPTMNLGPRAPQANETITIFNSIIRRNYHLKQVRLKNEGIPSGLKCLIIARPTEKFSDYELYQIDQALMNGTNIALFVDTLRVKWPERRSPVMAPEGPKLVPMDTGLEKLLSHYGVNMKQSAVMDKECYKEQLPLNQGGGESIYYNVPIIQSEKINKELDYIKNIKGLAVFKISPLELVHKRIKEQNIMAHELFASSDISWEVRDNIDLDPKLIRPPASEKEYGSSPLAFMLEGTFSSYFTGKSIPEKPVTPKEGSKEKVSQKPETNVLQIKKKDSFKAQSPKAKIFVIASGETLSNDLLGRDGQSPTAMFVLNVIDALNGRDDIAIMRSKAQQHNPLEKTTNATRWVIKTANIVGLPLLTVAMGILVWLYRQARRRKIQLRFNA